MLEAALAYAARGWRVIPCHAVQNGRCSCHKGKNCRSKGKHPRLNAWEKAATTDEEVIAGWFDRWPLSNVGLVWGPDSKIIDIEFDDEIGRQNAEKLLGECFTPSYRSRRSVHRLFRWQEGLPEEAVGHVAGLEVRTGTNGGAQSIAPPSVHESGASYEWLPGLSPEDVDPQPIPPGMLDVIFGRNVPAVSGTDDPLAVNLFPGEKRQRSRTVFEKPHLYESKDERDNSFLSFACRFAQRSPNIDDAQEQADLWQTLNLYNSKCVPPLDQDELNRIFEQSINYRRRDVAGEASGYTIHGLAYENGEWSPGSWELTIVNSDPVVYRICVPAWRSRMRDKSGIIRLELQEYRSANLVAEKVQASVPDVVLDEAPKVWASIWNGSGKSRGIKAKLMDTHRVVEPSADAKRYIAVAEMLAEKINKARYGAEVEKPDPKKPSKLPDGRLWLRWKETWLESIRFRDVLPKEVAALSEKLGIGPDDAEYFPTHGKPRHRYCVLGRAHLSALDRILEEGAKIKAGNDLRQGDD